MHRPSDAALVERYQAGDEAAFTVIYERYAPLLRRYIERRCGSREWAEDIVQEAMLKAARYIPHGTMHDLNGYLILCARQCWWLRAEQERRRPETCSFDPHGVYAGHVGFVEDRVKERETAREAAQLLGYLPDDDREVALLRVFQGYDLVGAAAALGWTRSGASAAWRRATRRLARWKGTKTGCAALYQALVAAQTPEPVAIEDRCQVPGCMHPRHAYNRCHYHAEGMLARRRQLAAKREEEL